MTTTTSSFHYCHCHCHCHHKLPLVIYFHGGGFFVHHPFNSTYKKFVNAFVAETNTIVVSVHYGRAPENPLPMAYNQCWEAVKWVISHLSAGTGCTDEWLRHYGDPNNVFFAGDSAGANIAHNMAIRLGEEKHEALMLKGIILLCPYFWGKDPIPGETTYQKTRDFVHEGWHLACPSTMGSDDPWFNPVKDPKLSKLGYKKVLVAVAGKDVFRCRGWYYYETLLKNGWGGVVEIVETEGEDHVFFVFDPDSSNSKALLKRVASFILRRTNLITKRAREEDPSLESESNRTKFNPWSSLSNPSEPEVEVPLVEKNVSEI